METTVMIVFALVMTFVLIKIDVAGYFLLIDNTVSLRTIFLLGVIASVSTCLAVTGGIVVAMTDFLDTASTTTGHIKFHISFHIGRILSFALFGAVLGGVGQFISISLGFTIWLSILLAMMFIYMGGYLIGLFPSVSYKSKRIQNILSSKITSSRSNLMPFSVGVGSFFLPCGFTQSIQIMALASGSIITGSLMMVLFALGTLPGLVLLGVGTSYAKSNKKHGFQKIIAVVLLVFGMFTLRGNASVLGIQDQLISIHKNTNDSIQEKNTITEYITLSHDGYSLIPQETILQAGKNYEITITPENDGQGCMSSVVLPRIDSTPHTIKKGVPITYSLENAQSGQYSFVCSSMGMKQGTLIVE